VPLLPLVPLKLKAYDAVKAFKAYDAVPSNDAVTPLFTDKLPVIIAEPVTSNDPVNSNVSAFDENKRLPVAPNALNDPLTITLPVILNVLLA
jgi:hypothetical protein